uniref:DNA excision repair protein ERCC-6 n=2 Tax=Mesocestoides corti TaxID=53468 RepID=A0A5K3FXC3_MESCO
MSSNTSPSKENKPPSDHIKQLENEARILYESGNILGSLRKLQTAFEISPTDRLKRRIDRVKSLLPHEEQKSHAATALDRLITETNNLSIHEDRGVDKIRLAKNSSSSGKTSLTGKENACEVVNELLTAARLLFEAGKTKDSLEKVKQAYAVLPDPKTARKIERLEAVLASEEKQAAEASSRKSSNISTEKSPTQRKSTSSLKDPEYSRSSNSSDHPSASSPTAESGNSSASNMVDELLAEARSLCKEGKILESIQALEEAYKFDSNPKIARKIVRLKASLDSGVGAAQVDPAQKASELEKKARELFHQGDYPSALNLLQRANALCHTDKLERRIARLKDLISVSSQQSEEVAEEGDDDDVDDDIAQITRKAGNLSLRVDSKKPPVSGGRNVVELADDFYLPRALHDELYEYQRDGVRWLWNLHKTSPGGILADDMGLGKTLQTIAFLTGLFLSEEASKKPRTVLILTPVSVINTWQSEFAKWSPSLKLVTYYEMAKNARQKALISVQRRGGILLTTYNMLVSGLQDIGTDQAECACADAPWRSTKTASVKAHADFYIRNYAFTYDYVILDEAHRIKNTSTMAAKAVRALASRHRLLLTGTAVQNNLRELWSLFDFTHEGRLLGTQKTFLMEYEKPIMRSRERDATGAEKLYGNLMSNSLLKMISPFILRRTKQDTLAPLAAADASKRMPQKNEIVVWVYLSPLQEQIYRSFLKLDHVKELLFGGTKRSPLVELNILKKLCDHPRLLSTDQCVNLGLDVSKALPGSDIRAPSRTILMQESGKLAFVVRLLEHFQEEALKSGSPAHRTLIFSQSLRLLDMTEVAILGANEAAGRSVALPKHKVLRLDGRLKKLEERLKVLNEFASDHSYTAMLLTTQVGGVGLTITSADRVVILDPSWNPSVDAQAVDRVYRIGQLSNVIVYRLITCATVEEKIYRRQVYKDSVIRHTIGRAAVDCPEDSNDPYRYFTRQELVELFTLDENSRFSATQRQLAELHGVEGRKTYPELEAHLAFVTAMRDVVFDISDHDLLFSRQEDAGDRQACDPTTQQAEKYFAENRLKVGEAILNLEAKGDLAAAERLRQTQFAPRKLVYNQPAGDIFVPSKADSLRPMFNAPGCGARRSNEAATFKGSPKLGFVPASTLLKDSSLKERLTAPPAVPTSPKSRYSIESPSPVLDSPDRPSSSPLHVTASPHSSLSIPPVVREPGVSPQSVENSYDSESFVSSEIADANTRSSQRLSQSPREEEISIPTSEESSRSSDDSLVIFTQGALIQDQQPAITRLDSPQTNHTPKKAQPTDSGPGDSVEAFARPSVFPPHVRTPKATSSPFHTARSTSIRDVEMVSLDLTQPVEDEEIDNSVQMLSLRQSLAKSGIFLDGAPTFHVVHSSDESQVSNNHDGGGFIRDSCGGGGDDDLQSTASQEVSVPMLSDSIDVIEASFPESD